VALVTSLSVGLLATLTKTPGLTVPASQAVVSRLINLLSGTAAGQADRMYAGTRTLTASSTEDLDLAGGLTDEFAATITFARVKAIWIAAAAANTNNVLVGGAASNQWATFFNTTGVVTLRPDAFLLGGCGKGDATGYAVTAGTGDLLKVANSAGGTSVSYDLIVVGASA